MKAIILGWLFLFVNSLIFGNLAAGAKPYPKDVPAVVEGAPEPGIRVRVYLEAYPHAYYVLYLPYNFDDKLAHPLIFESPANPTRLDPWGYPEETVLGFGLSEGYDFIWVSVPFVDEGGHMIKFVWGNSPETTVNFWLAVLNDLDKRFTIDKKIIAGFSRGAVSCSYIGNFNEEISNKWDGYFAHAHFDGCCQTVKGDVQERIERIKQKKVLLSAGCDDIALKCTEMSYERLITNNIPVTILKIPNTGHHPYWILEQNNEAEQARKWARSFFNE
jgi:hypothetical protein